MRLVFGLAAIALAVVSCGRNSPSERVLVQNEPVHAEPETGELPKPVRDTISELTEIAHTGSTWDMARQARATPGFRSNTGGLEHADYWYLKYRSGDWPMEHLKRVLAYPPAVEESAGGLVYVWPYMATLRPSEMTAKARRDARELLGEFTAEQVATGASWPGYRLGVADDGAWLYFYSGAE